MSLGLCRLYSLGTEVLAPLPWLHQWLWIQEASLQDKLICLGLKRWSNGWLFSPVILHLRNREPSHYLLQATPWHIKWSMSREQQGLRSPSPAAPLAWTRQARPTVYVFPGQARPGRWLDIALGPLYPFSQCLHLSPESTWNRRQMGE